MDTQTNHCKGYKGFSEKNLPISNFSLELTNERSIMSLYQDVPSDHLLVTLLSMVSIHVFVFQCGVYNCICMYLCGVYECLLVVLLPTGEQHSIVRAPGQHGNTLTVTLHYMLLDRLRSLDGGKT